jgi:Domain of unknown function (DUF397)
LDFKISSFCTGGGCVEVGHLPTGSAGLTSGVVVRDAKDPIRRVSITFNARTWRAFLAGTLNGEFTE